MKSIILTALVILAFSLEGLGQEGMYFYGADSKPVQQLADAVSNQEVKKKSERKSVIEKQTSRK